MKEDLNLEDRFLDDEELEITTAYNVVYENQRGSGLFGPNVFSAKGLLPGVDYPAWSSEYGKFELPIERHNCLPTWMWIGEWMVDLSIDCDADGWQYAGKFSSHNWHGYRNKTCLVRRRRWMRLCKRVPSSIPSNRIKLAISPEIVVLQTLAAALREFKFKANDRERLGWLKTMAISSVLKTKSLHLCASRILEHFDYEVSKIKACEQLASLTDEADDRRSLLQSILQLFIFNSDREYVLRIFTAPLKQN